MSGTIGPFEEFVRRYSVRAVAAKLGVSQSAIYKWVEKRTSPNPRHAFMIEQLARAAGFELTVADVYEHRISIREVPPDPEAIRQRASQWI